VESEQTNAAQGATLLALSRRKGRHLLFALLREVGLAARAGRVLDSSLLRTLGAWCLRRLLIDYHPPADAVAKLKQALLFPAQQSGNGWSTKAQARCLLAALRGLKQAIAENHRAAAGYGLKQSTVLIVQSNSPVGIFNRAYRRRTENLIDFSTTDAVAAAGGHDTLAAGALRVAGQELLHMAQLGDHCALLVCLEAITHLPSDTALRIPVKTGEKPHQDALAWLDVRNGTYCQVLYRIKEKGGKPQTGSEDLYERTTQLVTIRLSPPLANLLRRLMQQAKGEVTSLADLTGHVGHHPRSSVVGTGPYRVTARRIQESIPTLLLQGGALRWPVAIATNSQFLATAGRRAYGVCSAREIQKTMNQAYKLLGWPEAPIPDIDELVGSMVTPRPESITSALNYLSGRANDCSNSAGSREKVVRCLNTHAEWFSMFLALALALRAWQVYKIRADELLAGDTALFDDKDVHEHKGPGNPVAVLMKFAVGGWFALCQTATAQLEALGDFESLALATRIKSQQANKSSTACFFTIDAVGRLTPMGHLTWMSVLPANIRLLPNFARHFWPMQLMELGIKQVDIDIQMRHRFDALTPGSSHMVTISAKVMKNIRTAIDRVLSDLKIQIPDLMKGACHV
jgi:hypothetical protein